MNLTKPNWPTTRHHLLGVGCFANSFNRQIQSVASPEFAPGAVIVGLKGAGWEDGNMADITWYNNISWYIPPKNDQTCALLGYNIRLVFRGACCQRRWVPVTAFGLGSTFSSQSSQEFAQENGKGFSNVYYCEFATSFLAHGDELYELMLSSKGHGLLWWSKIIIIFQIHLHPYHCTWMRIPNPWPLELAPRSALLPAPARHAATPPRQILSKLPTTRRVEALAPLKFLATFKILVM